MRKFIKLIGFASATLVLFFVVAFLAFYDLVRVGDLRRFLVDQIEKQTDFKVQLGAADFEIGWITGIVFQNLALSEGNDARPALTAERVTARVALRPLLRRQVIFYEIHLTRPVAHLVRNRDGHVALIDKLLNLPFLKQHHNEFSLDLRSVKVDGADIEFMDRASTTQWQLINGKFAIERLRGQRLREFFQRLVKRGPQRTSALAAAFDVNGILIKNGSRMNLNSHGYVAFPQQNLDLRQAHWNADLEMVDFPAQLIKETIRPAVPIKSVSGHLAGRVRIEGSPAQDLHFRGEAEFKQVSIDAPEVFYTPLDRADGHVTFQFEWRPSVWRLQLFDFRSNDLRFSLQGEIQTRHGADHHVRLTLSGLSAPVSVLRKYLPLKLVQSPWLEQGVDAVESGQIDIKQAGVDATLAELQSLAQGHISKGISFTSELRDFSAKLPIGGGFPLRGVSGRVTLANRVLAFQNVRGDYGDMRLTSADGTYSLSTDSWGKMDVHGRGDVNLAELKEQLKLWDIAPRLNNFLATLEELSGRSRMDVTLKRSHDEPLDFAGKMFLDRVQARYHEYVLNELQGNVAFTPDEIRAQSIRAQLNGWPVQLQISLKNYANDAGTFDLGVESSGVRAGVITSLLLDSGSPRDSGTISGAIRYSGSIKDKAKRKFTGNLDLQNVQVMVQPLLQPLRALTGKINIDEAGIGFQNLTASLVGFPVVVNGRWRYHEKTQLLFDFTAPDLDISYLISQIDPEATELYANLVAQGNISLAKGRIKDFDFSDLKTAAIIDHRVWHLTNLTARSAGGSIEGVTTIFDKPDTLAVVAEPKIQGVPIQSFLRWFDISNTEMTGKVNLSGKLETVGSNDTERKQNLNGAFTLKIEDGTIHRMRIVVQLLNLLDLSRWFSFQLPDLAKQGIRFRAITGDFKVNRGVYSTDNLIVDSSDLRMSGAGKVDVPKGQMDFVVAVRPFAGIDTAMSYIPLIGRGIAAIKNSFLVASFNITGHIDDPTITPAPLGTLSEWFWGVLGIPKKIIGFGDLEKAEGAKQEIPKPPADAANR